MAIALSAKAPTMETLSMSPAVSLLVVLMKDELKRMP
ncbi:hypothetical protein CCACVL1_07566 [Corchorus capsularis]|uniref:Uncharacterized protein n=1 Tax=Corchorus capsularis TaxID=210143 RepID=A0A1R3J513_COCAP|nr:hypothetical protein CCACVL1_07566 [Corchorus capsularis]